MRSLAALTAAMLTFSSIVWTAGPVFVGRVRSSGVVLANSTALPDGGTVRSGDLITTQSGALAVITSPIYGRVEVRQGSQARIADDRIRLDRGAVASSRLPVETSGFAIQPRNGARAWFAVANREGRIIVAAHRGNVVIASTGMSPVIAPEGSFAEQDDQPESQPDRKTRKRPRRKGGAASVTGGGWAIGGLSHSASLALVVAVGAGVAAATVGAATMLGDDNPSPGQ